MESFNDSSIPSFTIAFLLATIFAVLAPIQPLLLSVGFVIFLDTLLGIISSIKIKTFDPFKVFIVLYKMLIYQLTVLSIYLIDFAITNDLLNKFVDLPAFFITKLVALVFIIKELTSVTKHINLIFNTDIVSSTKKFLFGSINFYKNLKDAYEDEEK